MSRIASARVLVVFVHVFMTVSAAIAAETALKPALDRPKGATYSLEGPVRQRIGGVIKNWLMRAPDDNPAMLKMFADRDREPYRDLLPWSGEFAGKYLTASTEVLRLTQDPALKTRLQKFVNDFVALQDANGYLGPFPKKYQLTGTSPTSKLDPGHSTWDAWGHYHAMIGLLLWHQETSDAKALTCARRIGDLLCEKFLGPDKTVFATGSSEMNQAVVHSLALLYKATGEKKYLDLSQEVVAEFALNGAGDYLRQPLAGKEFYQLPKPRWESLHPIMGLAELYWITGNEDYRKAFERIWWSIAKLDRHNNGGFSSGEQAQGNPYHPGAIETCCTIAWMAMSVDMLRMTANPIVADELELSTLNQVVGLHSPKGDACTYNTPMNGTRVLSTVDIAFQIRPGSEQLNCCSVNAARGFGMISDWAVMTDGSDVLLNWYGPSTFEVNIGNVPVKLRQVTQYPREGKIELHIDPVKPAKFPLRLRIPHWSEKTAIAVNGAAVDAKPGTYLAIDRLWQQGDVVTLELDFSLRYWAGEREEAGKASVYRGPLLLVSEDSKGNEPWGTFGATRATRDRGATVEYQFEGDAVKWLGHYFDDAGKARVKIDGQEIEIVDQYGPKREVPFVWERKGLGSGKHTIHIEVLGEKSAASNDVWINVTEFSPKSDARPTFSRMAKVQEGAKAPDDSAELLVEVKNVAGQKSLRDFGGAGWGGKHYTSWLPIGGVKPVPFSEKNPSRTGRIVE